MTRPAICAAMLAILLVSSLGARAETMSLDTYQRAIARAAADLERTAKSGSTRDAIAAVGRLPEEVTVTRPSQPSLPVDNRLLLRTLREQVRGGTPGMRAAARTLRNLDAALSPADRTAVPSRADAALARVLNRREFRAQTGESFLDRLSRRLSAPLKRAGRAIVRFIERLLSRLRPRDISDPTPELALVVRILGFVSAAILLGALIWMIVRLVRKRSPISVQDVAESTEVEQIRPYRAWLADADAALQRGDYRAAVRALHMAALMRLDDAGYVSYIGSRTDGSVVRLLQQSGRREIAGALGGLGAVFARVWYGAAAAGPAEYEAARDGWSAVEGLIAT